MTITINKQTLIIVILAIALAWTICKLFSKDEATSINQQTYDKIISERNKKYSRDSAAIVAYYNDIIARKDSQLVQADKQSIESKKIIKKYESKIKYIQKAPIYIVDAKYDSVLRAIRSRYSMPR